MTDHRAYWLAAALCAAGCGGSSDAKQAEPEGSRDPSLTHEQGVVTLTAEQVAAAHITIAKAEKRNQAGLLSATAEVRPSEDGVARVGTRIAGRITALKAGLGDKVTKGKVLALIDSPDVGRAKADYLSAAAAWKLARSTADREKVLAEKKISSEQTALQAEAEATRAHAEMQAAAGRLRTMGVGGGQLSQLAGHEMQSSGIAVASPIAGEVVERSATLGQMAEPSDTLFVVMDLDQVWIVIDIYERDLGQVKLGQKVTARVAAYADRAFTGTVAAIGSVVEPKTRAVQVRVVIPNADRALKPGMFATVEVEGTSGVARERVVVPASAVQRDGGRSLVFLPTGERQYLARPVKTGPEAGGWIEIDEGIAEGETVVATGSFVLKSELKKDELGGED